MLILFLYRLRYIMCAAPLEYKTFEFDVLWQHNQALLKEMPNCHQFISVSSELAAGNYSSPLIKISEVIHQIIVLGNLRHRRYGDGSASSSRKPSTPISVVSKTFQSSVMLVRLSIASASTCAYSSKRATAEISALFEGTYVGLYELPVIKDLTAAEPFPFNSFWLCAFAK